MLRGEFIRGDGLVIPNNITTFGANAILIMALRGAEGALVAPGGNFYVGLCDAVPTLNLQISGLREPTIGAHGYARHAITRDAVGWPNSGQVNGEWYVESGDMVWTATDTGFDVPISRMFLCASATATTGDLICLSQSTGTLQLILPATSAALRTFRYRVYLR